MGIEIERRFLVTELPCPLPPGARIRQGYILNRKDRVVRIRLSENQGFMTIKGHTTDRVRPEFEYPIPWSDACQLLDGFCDPPLIEKTRHTLIFQGKTWVLDRFHGANQGLLLAEVELERPDEPVACPPWVGQEVTGDARYCNASLVRNPFTAWP